MLGIRAWGGRQRLVPVSGRFFAAVAAYLDAGRPPGAGTDRVFVVLKGPRRGQPLTAKGVEVVLAAARRRAGLDHATCHELRHTLATQAKMSRIASDASFGRSREHALPAARRAALRSAQCAGVPGIAHDLGCQQRVASDPKTLHLIPLH